MTTPKLRFKEFDGCWVQKIISEIADVRGGKRLPKGYSLQEENNGFPYITVTDMENGTVNLEKIRYVPLEAIDQIKRYRISVDEIYISVAGTLGLVGIIPQELNNANLTENADKLTNIKCNQFYLLHYLNNGSLSKLIDSVSTIGAQPKLALYAIQGMPIFLPSLDEQTKIASFLSAVDEKISQLSQKRQLLSQYKQGMMQKLFSQQIRFKADDGSEFSEWSFSKLNNYINESKDKSKYQDEYDVLTSSRKGLIKQTEYFEDSRLADRDNIGFNIIKQNEITYRSRSDDGLFFFNLNKLGITGIISTYYPVINMKNSDNRFFHAYLNFHKHEYVKYAVGTSQLVLSLNELRNMKFYIPCLAEQTKIANFLSSIDQKIEVTAQQIEQAKQWKKGLLQQMFV